MLRNIWYVIILHNKFGHFNTLTPRSGLKDPGIDLYNIRFATKYTFPVKNRKQASHY